MGIEEPDQVVIHDKDCAICGSNRWVIKNDFYLGMDVLTDHSEKVQKNIYNGHLIGIRVDGKDVCLMCFLIMKGLESFYGESFEKYLFEPHPQSFVNKMLQNKTLLERGFRWLAQGYYLPDSLVIEVMKFKDKNRHSKGLCFKCMKNKAVITQDTALMENMPLCESCFKERNVMIAQMKNNKSLEEVQNIMKKVNNENWKRFLE
jgi:hypothetical protein